MNITHFNLTAHNVLLRLRRERRISWRAVGLGSVIASYANREADEAWPSRATLSAITGIECRDITRVVKELQDAKFMSICERDGQSNIYKLTLGEIAALGKQPPTPGEIAEEPLGKQPPITMKEQSINNEGGAKVKKKREKKVQPLHPVFVEWCEERKKAGLSEPTPGNGNINQSKTLGNLVPDAIRRRKAMQAFFQLDDWDGWLKSKGYQLWQLVHHKLDTCLNIADGSPKPQQSQGNDLLDLTHRLDQVEARHGAEVARQYDARAREFGCTALADEWLEREVLCQTA